MKSAKYASFSRSRAAPALVTGILLILSSSVSSASPALLNLRNASILASMSWRVSTSSAGRAPGMSTSPAGTGDTSGIWKRALRLVNATLTCSVSMYGVRASVATSPDSVSSASDSLVATTASSSRASGASGLTLGSRSSSSSCAIDSNTRQCSLVVR